MAATDGRIATGAQASRYRADVTTNDIAAQRARLAEIETELARLRERYDLLMNAFRFDAAKRVHARIETAERERRALADALPPQPPAEPATPYTVKRPRRRR
jgi:hypothetical protein